MTFPLTLHITSNFHVFKMVLLIHTARTQFIGIIQGLIIHLLDSASLPPPSNSYTNSVSLVTVVNFTLCQVIILTGIWPQNCLFAFSVGNIAKCSDKELGLCIAYKENGYCVDDYRDAMVEMCPYTCYNCKLKTAEFFCAQHRRVKRLVGEGVESSPLALFFILFWKHIFWLILRNS